MSHCPFSVISRTLTGGSYPSAEKQSAYSTAPADWASRFLRGLGRCMLSGGACDIFMGKRARISILRRVFCSSLSLGLCEEEEGSSASFQMTASEDETFSSSAGLESGGSCFYRASSARPFISISAFEDDALTFSGTDL